MAKRRPSSDSHGRVKRHRRSSEELIADLQRTIEHLRQRQAAQKLKTSAAVRAALAALRLVDKGLSSATLEEDAEVQLALSAAREPLAAFLGGRGIELAKRRRSKARRAQEPMRAHGRPSGRQPAAADRSLRPPPRRALARLGWIQLRILDSARALRGASHRCALAPREPARRR